jgi:ketosteroid isomerase-like protein
MAARTPAECHQLLAAAFTAGEVQAIMRLYEPGGVMITLPDREAVGRAAFPGLLQDLLAMKPPMQVETLSAIQVGDLALLRSRWRITGTGADAQAVEFADQGTEVVRRQPDGAWLFVIDDPYAAAGSK